MVGNPTHFAIQCGKKTKSPQTGHFAGERTLRVGWRAGHENCERSFPAASSKREREHVAGSLAAVADSLKRGHPRGEGVGQRRVPGFWIPDFEIQVSGQSDRGIWI